MEMLLVLLTLVCCVPQATACLQCVTSIRRLYEDFILSAPTVNDQIELQKIFDQSYVSYRTASQARKGVIDPTTLYRATTEYQSEFHRFLNEEKKAPITQEALQIVAKSIAILEKHLDFFIQNELCPNECGLLNRRVMDCIACHFIKYVCPSPTGQQDCGELPVHAEEGGEALLDCFVPWHSLLLGNPEYHYYWSPGVPGTKQLNESDFKALIVTDESSVVLNQLHVTEEGTYRCSLEENGTVFYRVFFLLNVSALPPQIHRPVVTLPSLPRGHDYSPFWLSENLQLPIIAMVTVLSLIASVGLIVILRKMKSQRSFATRQ